jgi:oxygen-dependent protoporphyrinogen oxidase
VINIVYPLPPSQIHPSGFGYLIPKPTDPSANPHGILGVVFDSTAIHLDGDLNGKVTKLTVMIGGPYWSTYPSSTSSSPISKPTNPKDLVHPAIQHLQSVFPVLRTVDPILTVANIHEDAIPTYTPGHVGRLAETHRAIKNGVWNGKLSLAGNGLGGVGVNDCVLSAEGIVQGFRDGKLVTGLEGFATGEEEAALV